MQRDERLDLPALYPLLAFVAALTLGPAMAQPRASLAGFAVIALLLVAARRPRLALIAMLIVAGLALGLQRKDRIRAERSAIAAIGAERFVTVEAPIRSGWRSVSQEQFRLIAERFTVVHEQRRVEFHQTLIITIGSRPPEIGTEALLLAEGFLRAGDGEAAYLSVKSPRLMLYRDPLPLWSVAGFNRRMNNALSALARQHPRQLRAIFLAQALALGRSEQLPDDVRESYRRGGIYHLLVFSGMQIALAAAFLAMLFRAARAPRAADWTLLILSILAPMFAGNEPSVARSSWMIGLFSVSRLLRRPTRADNLLFVSALLRLLAHPEEIDDAGFALTYAAAGGLLLAGRALADSFRRRAARALAFGAGAELATAPLTLTFFHQYVAAGSIVTLLASPVIAAMLALSALAAVFALFAPAVALAFLRQISHLDRICVWMASLVGERLGLSGMAAAPPPALVAACFALFLLLLPFLKRRGRIAASLLFLVPIAATVHISLRGSPHATPTAEVLDVGQGDAILLRNGGGAVLVDGGGRMDDRRWGRTTFVPMLLDRGVRSLDAVALSHPDPDHCGGLVAALEHLRVRELWIFTPHLDSPCGRELLLRANEQGTTILPAERLTHLRRIGLDFDVATARLKFKRARWNNSSVLVRVRFGHRYFLASGDIEKEAERLHADESPMILPAEVLKIPHHGSRSSSTERFLEHVRPRIAIISCGRRNRFGHPSGEVLARLSEAGVLTLRTDRSGSLLLNFEKGLIFVRRQFDTPRHGL